MRQFDYRTGSQWEKYYTIISSDASQIESFLLEMNISDYLSYKRSRVEYNDISSIKTVLLSEISDRFNSLDPRIDPYMRGIKELFTAQSGEISYDLLYVERNAISIFKLYWLLSRNFPLNVNQWHIGGFEPLKEFSPIVLFVLYLLVSIIFVREKRLKYIICLLVWSPFVFHFGYSALGAALTLSYLLYKQKSPLYISSVILFLLLYIYYTSFFSLLFTLTFLSGFAGNLFMLFPRDRGQTRVQEKWRAPKIKLRKPDHELFAPVRILAAKKESSIVIGSRRGHLLIPSFFLILIAILSTTETKEDSILLPRLEIKKGLSWTLNDLSQTTDSLSEDQNYLISPGDYITHMAFQEGFLYGTKWEFPRLEEPLLYPVYQSIEKGFSKSYEIKADYSEKWLSDKISVMNNDNPAKLLFSTHSPGFVIKNSNHYNNDSFILLKISFSMLLLLLIPGNHIKYKNISLSVKKKLLRRNEQVA
ncbi:MAG: hypothetical protein PF518_00145 [Spirochaetaceae bacterium]|nr:hypothetical protein [Spirochaetaceae bacterium]